MTLLIESMKFILAVGFYIEQIYGKHISARLDTDIVLRCPYLSTVTHPIIWFGPITSAGYAHNEKINTNISIHERLSLTGDNTTGEYNLNIHHLTRKDQGLYGCMTVLEGKPVSSEYTVIVLRKPTVLNDSTIYVFGNLESISNVTFIVDCYPKPVVSWIQSLGGKLGTWNVIDQKGGKFKVQSTVFPSKPNHLANYKVRVRNSEGSDELTVIMYGYGKPTVLNDSTIYVFGNIGSISNVTFLVHCYPKPVVSWIQTLGGKLGTWNVVDQLGDKFKVQSTVLPLKPNHLGNYKALVSNSEGSEELAVILYGYEPDVSIESRKSCSTSQNIKLICTIEAYDTNVWDNTWHHYRGGVYIRSLNGSVATGVSSLDIRYCDYQDTGTYVCSWTSKGVNVSASTDLIVYGSPIITDQQVSVQHGVCVLSVYFYTSVSSVKIKWYNDDKLMDGNLTEISSNVDINLFCYQKLVRTNGMKTYISYDTIGYLNSTINCQIQNKYGSTEVVFNQEDFHAIFGGDATSSINKITEGQTGTFENMHIYFAISAGGILVVMATIAAVGCIYKQGCKGHKIVLNTRNPSLHVISNETYSHQNESQYDEIDSTSYQSVTWRHYTLDDNVSVHRLIASDDKTVYHSIASDEKTVHHSTASDDRTVPHSTASDDKSVNHSSASDDKTVHHSSASDEKTVHHSTASDDNTIHNSFASDDKTIHHSIASDDKTVHDSSASDDKTVHHSNASDEKTIHHSTVSDDKTVQHSSASDDKTVLHSSASEDTTVHHSTASDDKTVHHSTASDDDKIVHHSTASDDKTVHHSTASDDQTVHHSTASDDKTVHHSSASDDKTVHHSIASDDKTVHHSTASDDKTVHHSTASDDKTVHHSSASDDKTVHHSTASNDKTLLNSTASDDQAVHNSTASAYKTVDHTLHSYEDLQDMEDEHHHYLQITPEEYITYTKDNIS